MQKMAPSRFVAVSCRRQDVDTSRFYGTSLGGCCDVVATTKTWFSQKVNARHPLEFSRERLTKLAQHTRRAQTGPWPCFGNIFGNTWRVLTPQRGVRTGQDRTDGTETILVEEPRL